MSSINIIRAQKVREQELIPITQSIGNTLPCGSGNVISPHLFQLQADATPTEGIVGAHAVENTTSTEQNVTFTDNSGGISIDLPTTKNTVAHVDHTEDLALGNFLSRPTLIDTFTWSTSDVVGVIRSIVPWYEFLNSLAIRRKIDNYAFMRGTLHVKVLVNGTPFQYGAMRTCYSPLLGLVSDKIRTNPVSDIPLGIPYSQQPGFYIYPQSNSGGEMPLRFFYHKNWLDITNIEDVQNMGTLNYWVYAPLAVAVTGGSTTVTVRTYAWMTDVELMGSTSKLTLQGDEYGNGAISRPASALAALASHMTNIPIIGSFARATEIGASAVSSIATLFGYTNVPVISNVLPYHPMNAPMLASAHIGVPSQKLALDPKQELSIDPAPHGIGSQDELSLNCLRLRESYFASSSWSTSDVAGSNLFNMRVCPGLFGYTDIPNVSAVSVGKRVYHTPLSYTANLFKHWRGDIVIRMKVVCTKFHKGRLKISYDPVGDISATDTAENTIYTHILDIGECDDIEFTIPYHQALAWLNCDSTIQDNWTEGNPNPPRSGIDNGILSVRCLTTLTAPASGSLYLLFFIRAGDNFEFANPAGVIGSVTNTPAPSFFALQGEDTTNMLTENVRFGNPTSVLPERYAMNFGECVGSLRNLLHRSVMCETTPMPTGLTGLYNGVRKLYKRMPYTPGYDPLFTPTNASKIVAASGTYSYVWNTMPHIAYISGMFLGYRGSVNYTVTPSSDKYGYIDDVRVVRVNDTRNNNAPNRFITSYPAALHTDSVSKKAARLNLEFNNRDGLAGCAITTTRTNGSIIFNFPDYNNYNFSLVDPQYYVLGNPNDGTVEQGVALQLMTTKVAAADPDLFATVTLQTEVAAGPDFTCLHFLCCPTLDYANAIPATA